MQLQWIIRSLHDFQAFDEFAVGRFRLRLMGTFHLYKFVETLEDSFGGEAKLISALDVKTAVKTLKGLANDRGHDERHAPKVPGDAKRLSAEHQNVATNYAYDILRAYEKYLRLQVAARGRPN